jgi:hypothetical protein
MDEKAPNGWNSKGEFNAFNNGKPDFLTFAWDPENAKAYQPGSGKMVATTEMANDAAAKEVERIRQAHEKAETKRPTRLRYQRKGGEILGAYDPANRIIGLVEGKADVSTLVHEVGHYVHDLLLRDPRLQEAVRKRYGDLSDREGAERFARYFESCVKRATSSDQLGGFGNEFSKAGLVSRAKAANLGQPLDRKQEDAIEGHWNRLERISRAMDEAKRAVFQGLLSAGGQRLTGARKAEAISAICRLTGIRQVGHVEEGRFRTVDLSALLPRESKIWALARHHLAGGAGTQKDLLGLMQRDLPHLSEDAIFSLLNSDFRELGRALDAEKQRLDESLKTIRKWAEYRNTKAVGGVHPGWVDSLLSLAVAGSSRKEPLGLLVAKR